MTCFVSKPSRITLVELYHVISLTRVTQNYLLALGTIQILGSYLRNDMRFKCNHGVICITSWNYILTYCCNTSRKNNASCMVYRENLHASVIPLLSRVIGSGNTQAEYNIPAEQPRWQCRSRVCSKVDRYTTPSVCWRRYTEAVSRTHSATPPIYRVSEYPRF